MKKPISLGPLLSCWPSASVTFFESKVRWNLTTPLVLPEQEKKLSKKSDKKSSTALDLRTSVVRSKRLSFDCF
ncbi:MAG: hypothetical protein JNK65_03675 [Deltaproteobacteria bacterium]|nr:hypothetical protein [Deltaproteobacteria bacterium]